MLKLLDIFSGIGGFSLGLERTGYFKTVAFCEIDDYPRRVLKKHWPEVPIYDDVRTLSARRLAEDGIEIDAICGGFPCQDLSNANGVYSSRPGLDGSRSGLWSEYARLIDELRPKFIIVENVPQLRHYLDRVLGNLAQIGYDAEWDCLQQTVVGGRCPRERMWLVSYPSGYGLVGQHGQGKSEGNIGGVFDAISRINPRPVTWKDWVSEPAIPRVVNGVPNRMDRINRTKGIGNAVVPQIAELIGNGIKQFDLCASADAW